MDIWEQNQYRIYERFRQTQLRYAEMINNSRFEMQGVCILHSSDIALDKLTNTVFKKLFPLPTGQIDVCPKCLCHLCSCFYHNDYNNYNKAIYRNSLVYEFVRFNV